MNFDDQVEAKELSVDLIILRQLDLVSYCSTFCNSLPEKLRFINSVRTLITLTTYHWILDNQFQKRMAEIDKEFLEIFQSCEPSQRDILNGTTPEGAPLIDLAAQIAREKFQLVMGIITKANKKFTMEDNI